MFLYHEAMKTILLCLHGWGGSKESFTELRAALGDTDIEMLIPDLPGFGSEPEPKEPWTNDDYADWVTDWTQSKLKSYETNKLRLFLLGHSHGGRIAIKLAARPSDHLTIRPLDNHSVHPSFPLPISHLFLCAPAGVRRHQPIKRFIGFVLAKTGKWLLSLPLMLNRIQPLAKRLLYRLMRTHDYETATPAMRQTMIRVSSEDLRPLLPLIDIPTDIFWGHDDRMTPFTDAKLVHEGIRGSKLHSYANVRHGVHKDRAREIAAAICSIT